MCKYFIICFFYVFALPFYSQNKKKGNKPTDTAFTYFNKAYNFSQKNNMDSAYIYYKKAQKNYETRKDSVHLTHVLINLSRLQLNLKDYNGSENNTIKALEIAKALHDKNIIANCYKKLGILAKEQQHFLRAIGYHKTALSIANTIQNSNLQIASLTNIGITYKEKKEYANAITNFNKALQHDSINNYPIKKARLLDYIGYCNFKQGIIDGLPKPFFLAKSIQEKIDHKKGIVTSNLHIAEFYLKQNKKELAQYYLLESLKLAKQTQNNDGLLTTLLFLSEASPKKATQYFKTYKKLSDSINNLQRIQKEQFSRIKFETREKEEKIELQKIDLQSKNKQQNMLLVILGLTIFSLFIFGFLYKKLQSKNIQITNLQKEIHHRVKNNLGMVNRFISVSKKKTADTSALENYNILSNRLETIKSIHELLYKNKLIGKIDLQQFIEKICSLTSVAYHNDKKISIHIDANIFIDSKKSEPIGLIINELITNAYKYAFVLKESGEIEIICVANEKNITLQFSDNGVGFPKNLDIAKTKSYGLKLVNGLTKQLNGKIKLSSTNNGSNIEIIIPK